MSDTTRFARPLPLGTIAPLGWLRQQLQTQADGLGGSLHEFWPDIRDSQWRGGSSEGWERVPYWLDGFIPLAILLQDPYLTKVATKWIEILLDGQHDDGWFGPRDANESHGNRALDPWPQFVLFKAFLQWHEATGEPRILAALLKAARRIQEVLQEKPLWDWAKMRWMELALSLRWLHEQTGEAWLLELIALAATQGYDWQAHFTHFVHTERATQWTLENHVVNHAMALKEPLFRGGRVEDALAVLDRYHGQANGMFSGDESLAGLSPSQGTELCAVVEALFSLECAFAEYGSLALQERFERIAYNALPATFTKDMWAHQYDQQVNQVLCTDSKTREETVFTTNGPRSNLFGLEPNFGCCTANFHQGWPKLVSHLWHESADSSLTALSLAPCRVTTEGVTFRVETNYPFEETILITAERGAGRLRLPIPTWAKGATLDGNLLLSGRLVEADIVEGEQLVLNLPFDLRIEHRPSGGVSLYVGPLLFCLQPGEDIRLESPELWADREVHPTTPWNYALDLRQPLRLAVPLLQIEATAHRVPEWEIERHAAGPMPASPVSVTTPAETITLVPYGSTLLRVAEFPTV